MYGTMYGVNVWYGNIGRHYHSSGVLGGRRFFGFGRNLKI